MRLIIFLLLFSTNLFADGVATFEKYKDNLPLLINDISRMETVVQKNNSPIYQEFLREMNLLKNNFGHISNPLKLEKFYEDAKENRWINIGRMTKELIASCESPRSRNLVLCKNGLEQMKNFTQNANLSEENKNSIATFVDDYISQVNAMSIIDPEFITNFNKYSLMINIKIQESAAKIPQMVVKVKPITKTALLSKSFYDGKENYLALGFVFFILMSFSMYFFLSRKNKIIENFYKNIFSLSKKNNLNLKMFGKLSNRDAKFIKRIEASFLRTLDFSKSLSSSAQIKIKSRDNNTLIEVNYFTSRAIQNVITLQREKSLKESLSSLQETVEAGGGELIFSSRFN
jgi:hypothetical protein